MGRQSQAAYCVDRQDLASDKNMHTGQSAASFILHEFVSECVTAGK
jgi:hypothetical protein